MTAPLQLQGWAFLRRSASQALEHERTSRGEARIAVLVVDDDRRVRQLTARMLQQSGYRAIEAASAAEALEALNREPEIRVLISDIVMPGVHGVELAEQVRVRYPGCRVVLVTGYAPELLGHLGISRLRFPVLIKPFQAEDLARQVRAVLEERH